VNVYIDQDILSAVCLKFCLGDLYRCREDIIAWRNEQSRFVSDDSQTSVTQVYFADNISHNITISLLNKAFLFSFAS